MDRNWTYGAMAAVLLYMALGSALWPVQAGAARLSDRTADVRNTKHNLTPVGPGEVKAVGETQVCVFCHTPHGATPGAPPLWNRPLFGASYTPYSSSSLDAESIRGQVLDQPGGSSKLCLSCHDGTLAIGNVNVLGGQSPASIGMSGTGPGGTMPHGLGSATGFTRNLGIDLSNDHPISLTFDNTLTSRDRELRDATLADGQFGWSSGGQLIVGVRGPLSGLDPFLPLEKTGGEPNAGQVQCGTCHDAHLRIDSEALKGPQKFLRLNRFQEVPPSQSFNVENDMVCLGCHDKDRDTAVGTWSHSVHANPLVADEIYTAEAAAVREFPPALPVWKAACLNCHDAHTIPGARRLLREGTDGVGTPKSGGAAALEEGCYQCHTSLGAVITPTTQVADIRTEFALPRHMPITSADQPAGMEAHDIGGNFIDAGFIDCTTPVNGCGRDFAERRAVLGHNNLANRHAECTDCHNPHRVVKFRDFRGVAASGTLAGLPDPEGTHPHTDSAGFVHSNILSGVLRGSWGVEPIYASASFQGLPSGYLVKRGDPGPATDISLAAPYVTREYQICLKCHSDYGFNDDNLYPNSLSRPQLGGPGLTPANAGGHVNFTSYSNQAKEFQAPIDHQGPSGGRNLGAAAGAAAAFNANNHRSWHPVMGPTGRLNRVGAFLAPWNDSGTGGQPGRLGVQTMYCSDCHGSDTAPSGPAAGTVIPTGGRPWGPHGSENDFLLKGLWDTNTDGDQANGLCFKCHARNAYAPNGGGGGNTGFDTDKGDGHALHSPNDKLPRTRCNWCHVAVPHGWKNRSLLVNLNDVGPEAGLAPGTQVRNNTTAAFSSGPYYRNAVNKIRSFPSGRWTDTNCGSAGAPGNGEVGRDWMRGGSESCANPP